MWASWRLPLTLTLGLMLIGAQHVSSGDASVLAVDKSAEAPACTADPTFADGKVPRQVRHVAVTGNDAQGDGSNNRPFRTLARAAQRVDAGTAIYLHAGTHAGGTFLRALRGSNADPIWIMGAPNEDRPVIRGGGEGLHLVSPRYVILQNIEIRETADNGINVDDGGEYANAEAARFVVFRDLDIHDTGLRPSGVPSCLKISGLNDFVVTGSRFAHCGAPQTSSAVGVNGVGVHRGRLRLNHFTQNGYGGVQFKGAARTSRSAPAVQDTGPRPSTWAATPEDRSSARPSRRRRQTTKPRGFASRPVCLPEVRPPRPLSAAWIASFATTRS
jgi:hypothetical protein